MDKTKRKIIYNIISVIIYILIVSFLSIENIVPDAMFLVGFITIITSTFLFLLKINLDRFKLFIWINLFFFCFFTFTIII